MFHWARTICTWVLIQPKRTIFLYIGEKMLKKNHVLKMARQVNDTISQCTRRMLITKYSINDRCVLLRHLFGGKVYKTFFTRCKRIK